MQDLPALDEVDTAMVHALQLNPRAPWTLIGEVIGIDPVTARRRWNRLESAGAAWLTAYPALRRGAAGVLAFVEVNCEADYVRSAARTLASDPRVASIEHVTGDRDLCLTVGLRSLAQLSHVLAGDINRVRGIRSTRTQLATSTFIEGSAWHLGALDGTQRQRLARRPVPATPPPREQDVQDLVRALAPDVRMGIGELAQRLGCGREAARRRLDSALAHRALHLRCDVVQQQSGWPVSVTLWADVPPGQQEDVARALARMPETRLSVGLTGGAANLLVSVWLRGLDDEQRLEAQLSERVPGLRIIDRAITLRHLKRVGWLLAADGRAEELVPVDPWAVPGP